MRDAPAEADPGRPDTTTGQREPEGWSGLLAPEADGAFTALADRTRRRILVRLAAQADDAGAVAADLGVSRQAVAKHLRILAGSGLVTARPEGRRQVHAVRPDRIREISDLLGTVSRGWDHRLATVKNRAERAERPG